MKAFKRSPEVQEAVERFEQLTGKTVWKAKRFQGSMKGYVQFIYQGNDKEFTKVPKYTSGDLRYLGKCVITFERSLDFAGGNYVGLMAVEVRWEDLGMSYNNAYMPKLRGNVNKLNTMFA